MTWNFLWMLTTAILITSTSCRQRQSEPTEPTTPGDDATLTQAKNERPTKISGSFVLDTPSKPKVTVTLGANVDSFSLSHGKILVTLDASDAALKDSGLPALDGAPLENSGQDFKCQRELCAAFFRAAPSEAQGFDLLVSVQEGGDKKEPRMILSWRTSDGTFSTAEADFKSITWSYPSK